MNAVNLKELDLNILIANARKNTDDGESFTEICRRFKNLVIKYSRQPHVISICEDAEGEAWLALTIAVTTYDESRGIQPAGYIESCIKYAVWNLFKKSRRRWNREFSSSNAENVAGFERYLKGASDFDTEAYVLDEIISTHRSIILQETFSKLTKKQQIVIKKIFIDKLPLKNLGVEMDITPQAVHNLKTRGLKQLRMLLEGCTAI